MASRGRIIAVLGLAAALGALVAAAPAAAQRAESRVRADRVVDQVLDGRPVTGLFGNAFIDRDSVTAAADTAYVLRDREEYELYGNVRLTSGPTVLTARRAHYRRGLGTGEFAGDVRVVEAGVTATGDAGDTRGDGRWLTIRGRATLVTPDYTVRADTIAQDRAAATGEAFGNVRIIEPGAANLVTGGHAVFERDPDVAIVDRGPEFTSRDRRGGLLVAQARVMHLYRAEDRVVMIDSVRIRQALGHAQADTAVALGRERLVLTGSPRVALNRGSVLTGRRIEFEYAGDQLRRVVLTGEARTADDAPDSLAALHPGLPAEDVLEGDVIVIDFEDEEIRRTEVVGSARSVYTPLDVDTELATNEVAGDTIIVHFRDRQVRRVRVLGRAVGTYRFAPLPPPGAAADSTAVAPPDTLAVAAADSLAAAADSLVAGGGAPAARAGGGRRSFTEAAQDVDYAGDRVTFELRERTMEIDGAGKLDYGTTDLQARQVRLALETRELYASGEPVAKDGDTVTGRRMGYNFRHRSAVVDSGVTAFDDYYYVGRDIRRFSDQTMKIESGCMTSCDLSQPHYHFWSQRMKMRPGDKVVAAPIVLRIGNVPVFALPFYFKNLKEGRRSGILFPSFDFGWSSREGRYIRDLGYYWAISDYLDFLVQGDYNESRDFALRSATRYVKRYGFTGAFDWSRRDGLGDDDSREWQVHWTHNQPALLDDYQVRADVRLASNTLSRNDLTGSDSRDIVSGQFKSSAYVSRNWSGLSASLNASRDGRVNAEDDLPTTDNLLYNMTLPSLGLNFRQVALKPALAAGRRGSLWGDLLRATYFQQGYSLKQDRRGFEERDERTESASGNWSLRVQPPRLGIFNFSFNANASQAWRRETTSGRRWVAASEGGDWQPLAGTTESTSPSVSFGASLGTTLYGVFPVRAGALRAIRHTVRMSSGWSVSPALGDKQPFNTSLSLSLDQRFDVKYRPAGVDSAAADRKLDGVLDWSLSTSYSPRRSSGQRWGDIASGLTIKPGQSRYLQLKVSNTIDPRTLALKDTRFSYGVNFGGRVDLGGVQEAPAAARNPAIERLGLAPTAADSARAAAVADSLAALAAEQPAGAGMFDGSDADFAASARPGQSSGYGSGRDETEGGRYLPFTTSGSLSYAYTNATADRRASANLSVRANLSRYWEFSYQTSFDLVTGAALRQQYTLGRDLHCWRLEFNRTVSALDSQFGFRLYLKSIPSLKFTRGREDYMGALGDGLGGLY